MAVDDDTTEHQLSQLTSPDIEAGDQSVEAEGNDARVPQLRVLALAGGIAVLVLAGLIGWFAIQTYRTHEHDAQRNVFIQVARQGALNLTTIDYEHAEADIQRILDSATGAFYDDFDKRSQPFIEVLKKAQAKSVGSITEAGLESETDHEADVLVSVNVETTNAGSAEQTPRAWRMRISVTQADGPPKVSNVAFVP